MTATRRVYENDDLVRRILGFLTWPELKSIATLERAFFPLVVGILWREVDVWQLKRILDSPRSEYRAAVRYVEADYIAGNESRENVSPLSEQKLALLRQRCPGLLGYSQDSIGGFHVPQWNIRCYPDGGGLIHYSYDKWVDICNDFDPTSPPEPGPEPVWQGYEMICTAGLGFRGQLDPTFQLIASELADATDRGEEWIDPRFFLGLIWIDKEWRKVAADVMKIRNASIQDGWSIEEGGEGP
ncbi:hypothetical protein EHS25_000192 [Saitozyma podzolica]|uniref:Uncharacterized protein n=1 Tax=Saitozyma podzolica TaxID=1890683 RepID=A0A427YVP4_9TREE|nr:hypothetical protein EHS25_000192 [Saitozyma podzolica]